MRFVPRGAELEAAQSLGSALVAAAQSVPGEWALAAWPRLVLRRGTAAQVRDRARRAQNSAALPQLLAEALADIPQEAPPRRANKSKRVAALVAAGRPAAAVRAAGDAVVMAPAEAEKEVRALLEPPQPPPEQLDYPQPPAAERVGCAGAAIKESLIADARGRRRSAAVCRAEERLGSTAHGRRARGDGHGRPALATAFRAYYLAVVGGRTDGEATRVVRLTPLRKPNGKARPVCVQPLLARCVSRAATRIASRMLAPALRARGVIGVGTPAAIERATHQLRRVHAQRGGVLFKADVANAYGTISRRAVRAALQAHAPGLVPLFDALYKTSPRVWMGANTHHTMCVLGLIQGEPTSSLVFSLGAMPALGAPAADPDILVSSFVDDVTGWAKDVPTVQRFMEQARAAGARIGLRFDPKKCQATRPVPDMEHEPGGLVLLGVPVGSDAYVREHAMARAQKAASAMRAFAQLDALPTHAKLWLLAHCGALPRIRCHALRGAAARGRRRARGGRRGAAAAAGFARLAPDVQLHPLQVHERPIRLGGCGVGSRIACAPAFFGGLMAQQVARERAPDLILAEDQRRCGCGARAAASCEHGSCNLCCALTHTACPRAPRAPPLPACIAGDSELPSAAAALAAATPGATTTRAMVAAQWAAAAPGGAQRALSRAMWRARCGALEREHREGGEVAVAAVARVHAGADALAAAWLVQPPAGRSTLTDDEVACALRGRLLLAVLPAGTPCACGNAAAHNAAAALHAQDYAARNCRVGSGGVVARHNDIARAITQHARAAGAHALSEWQAARRLPLVDGRPADLALMLGFGWVAVDVAQCELEGSAAMNRHALAAGRGVDFAARRHAKASRYDAAFLHN